MTLTERAMRWAVIVFLVATPLVYSLDGLDTFGLPKELMFLAEALLILCIVCLALVYGKMDPREWPWRDPLTILAIAITGWTIVAILFSTDISRSAPALLTVLAGVVIFHATLHVARSSNAGILSAVFLPALLNGGLGLLQEQKLWTPFDLSYAFAGVHAGSTGFLGNPNVVGTFLVGPALAALVWLLVADRKHRIGRALVAIALAAMIVFTQTVTAILAYVVGAFLIALFRSWQHALIAGLTALGIGLLTIWSYEPVRTKAFSMIEAAGNRDYDRFLSNRLTPFAAAWEMVKDDPATGIGPRRFADRYLPYALRVQEKYPRIQRDRVRDGFGDVHNDHLQVMAEAGIPAYLLFFGALVGLSIPSLRGKPAVVADSGKRKKKGKPPLQDERIRFARMFSLPLAISFAVLALAQFPLYMAAPRLMYLSLAAICLGWSRLHEDH